MIVYLFREILKKAVREYLDKTVKWRFGYVFAKLGKLHYKVKLDDGRLWKRHIDQIRSTGTSPVRESHNCNPDYNGHVEISNSKLLENRREPESVPVFAFGSKQRSDLDISVSSEEGGTAEADALSSPEVITAQEGRIAPEEPSKPAFKGRTRKPPDRYGSSM